VLITPSKNPGFTLVAVFTLALGVGANSALFSVVNAILLRPFPYGEPERLVLVWETQLSRRLPAMFASPPNYRDWRTQQTVFEDLAAFRPRDSFITQNAEQTLAQGAQENKERRNYCYGQGLRQCGYKFEWGAGIAAAQAAYQDS
jgi:hypothetical protein